MNVIFVHGWSDSSRSMHRVAKSLRMAGVRPYYFDYRSRDDQATIADFAEGLHMWMGELGLLQPAQDVVPSQVAIPRTLHFVTHSTGALVVRRWLQQYDWARAAERVASICFLAPANFGSPLAHKGRSFLGQLAKGIREMRDFGETGRLTLEALELASPLQWSLAEYDLFGPKGTVYGKDAVRAAVITGAQGYGGLRSFVNETGTDGTIVVAGAGLSCRKYSVDFASGKAYAGWISEKRFQPNVPCLILPTLTHSSILELGEHDELAKAVRSVLGSTPDSYPSLQKDFWNRTEALVGDGAGPRQRFQQFVFRLEDDRGDPIRDYFIEFGAWRRDRIDLEADFPTPCRDANGKMVRPTRSENAVSARVKQHFGSNVHPHSVDASYRRFLVEPRFVDELLGEDFVLTMKITVRSGDDDIIYDTERCSDVLVHDPKRPTRITWVFPDTTTLIDVRLDRYTRRITKLSRG